MIEYENTGLRSKVMMGRTYTHLIRIQYPPLLNRVDKLPPFSSFRKYLSSRQFISQVQIDINYE